MTIKKITITLDRFDSGRKDLEIEMSLYEIMECLKYVTENNYPKGLWLFIEGYVTEHDKLVSKENDKRE